MLLWSQKETQVRIAQPGETEGIIAMTQGMED